MAKRDLTQLKHALAAGPLHLYYEPGEDGENILRHIRVNARGFEVPSDGITIDNLPGDIIGTEQIKNDTVEMEDLSQDAKNSLVQATEKGASGGIATLGNDGKVPANQLPEAAVATESDVRRIVSNYKS